MRKEINMRTEMYVLYILTSSDSLNLKRLFRRNSIHFDSVTILLKSIK